MSGDEGAPVTWSRKGVKVSLDERGNLASDLALMANAHWLSAIHSFVADLGGRARQYGAVHAFLGGVPIDFANGCLILDAAKPSDVRRAVAWLSRAGVPYRIRIDASRALHAVDECVALGLERAADVMAGMVLRFPVQAAEPAEGVTVQRVDDESYDEFVDLVVETGIPVEWAADTFPRKLLRARDTALFIGRLHGRAAATSLAMRTGDVTGIYAVATVEDARRRGLGTAVTWASVEAARQWGSAAVILQASEMGHAMYRLMGFEDVVRYERFGPASEGTRP